MSIVAILLSLVIWGFIFYLLWWAKDKLGLGDPWDKGIVFVLVVATVVVIIGLLTGSIAPFPFLTGLV